MAHAKMIQLIAVAICAGLVYSAATFTPAINMGRRGLNMIGAESPVENTPPEYAFAIQAFGAFRSLLTDIAFIRAEQYKRAGRYYDAAQLASWICKLQPRFPTVWEFQSWNMAWNISVTTFTPEERWNWVYNGVKLVRDEGLRYNPRAVNLYKQIAWIYVNKMSDTLDDFHLTYKTYWAWRMHLLLGPPPDPLGEFRLDQPFERLEAEIGKDDPLADAARLEQERRRVERARRAEEEGLPPPDEEADTLAETEGDQDKEADRVTLEEAGPTPYELVKKAGYERIKAIDDAPRTLAELHQQFPETRAMVARLRELGVRISDEELSEDEYWRERGLAFTFFARYRRLTDAPSMLAQIERAPSGTADAEELQRFDQILGVRAQNPAGQALLRFLQRKVLNEVYKLDTAHMAYMMEFFGPMDWRCVDAHALYWITQGIIQAGETVSRYGNDKTNSTRIVFFALHHLALHNRMIFEPYPRAIERSYLNLTPDPNFVEPLHQAYVTYGKMIDPEAGPGAGQTYRTGHINLLTRGIQLLYLSDRQPEADHYYKYLQDTYPYNSDGSLNERYAKPLRDFVVDTLFENIETPKDTQLAINGVLVWAYNELAQGNRERYVNLVRWARRELYDRYMAEKSDLATIRLRLPPFPDVQADVLKVWLAQPAVSPWRTLEKSSLWKNLLGLGQAYLVRQVHDDLRPELTAECDHWNFDVARAFPEPPGMAELREQRAREGVDKREKTVHTPVQTRE